MKILSIALPNRNGSSAQIMVAQIEIIFGAKRNKIGQAKKSNLVAYK